MAAFSRNRDNSKSHGSRSQNRRVPLLLKYRSSDTLILIVVCAAVFTDIYFYGILVPVVPFALTERIGTSQDQVSKWNGIMLALYNLGLCLGSPVFGFYADHTSSRRLPFLVGLLALAASTLLLCLSRTMALFAIGRTLQGISAAICWAVGLALLADTFNNKIGWAAGWVNWAMTSAFLLSPVLGGIIYEKGGYYGVYYMAFGLIACDIALRLVLIEKKVARRWESGDAINNSGTPPTDEGNSHDVFTNGNCADEDGQNTAIKSIEGLGTASSRTTSGVRLKTNPYVSLIKSRRLLAALVGCILQSASKFAYFTVVPLFVQKTFHWNSLAAGFIFLCIFIPGFISPYIGILADRCGTKWLSCAGFTMSVPVFVCLRFVTNDTTAHKVLFGVLLTLMGIALTLSSTPLMAEITYVIEAKEKRQSGIWGAKGVYGVGFGLFTTSFALGGVIGSILAGYIYEGPGWNTFGWAFSVWCAGGAIISALFVGNLRPRAN